MFLIKHKTFFVCSFNMKIIIEYLIQAERSNNCCGDENEELHVGVDFSAAFEEPA